MLPDRTITRIREDFDRFQVGLPKPIEPYVLDAYGLSLESSYGTHRIKNPFGKASGQLSLNAQQIAVDAEAGLGFVVLKTLIAEDESGSQSMKAWAIPEARMRVERIFAIRADATEPSGWTVTWKGRGWSESFESYLRFFDEALGIGARAEMLVVPSCKYHLPQPGETEWRVGEYEHTTKQLIEQWKMHHDNPMPIEKDFSPTLAGDEHFSRQKMQILEWLDRVPSLIRHAAGNELVSIGLKLFNARFEDEFQLEMLKRVTQAPALLRADYLIYGNRLFDPEKEFEGKLGVAYGGPDLSGRNITTLSHLSTNGIPPISATGDIISGKRAFEYLKLGATSFQMHTLFQLPDREFAMRVGSRTERALHKLLFDPDEGFLKCVLEAKLDNNWPPGITIEQMASSLSAS